MVYEYTKPRAPIAATYKSPGPCYQLPGLTGGTMHDPRSVHNKNPSWQFGVKHGKFSDDCSPGPVHYPDVKYTRTGKDGTPHYSLYSRTKDIPAFNTPAAGTYSPEKSGPSAAHRAPQYSFGDRTRLRATDKNPAPNAYSLPTLLGKTVEGGKTQAACYSLRGRSKVGGFSEDLQKTPGPGTYTVTHPDSYHNKAPLYSMLGRNMMPGDGTLKPGPGAHSPERVTITKRSAPQPSFGIRHSDYTTPLIIDVCD
jgi:hypothetical protein